jgi:gliding motility-associated-like protein
MMDKFEKKIKEALENYEAPFDVSDWDALNKKIDAPKTNLLKWVGGTAAVIAISLTSYYLYNNNNISKAKIVNQKQISNENSKDIEVALNENSKPNPTLNDIENKNQIIDKNIEVANEINKPQNQKDLNSIPKTESEPSNTEHNNKIINESDVLKNTSSYKKGDVIPENLVSDFYVNKSEQCLGNEFVFGPKNGKQNVIYYWQFGDGTNEYNNGNIVSHNYSKPGVYDAVLTLLDSKTKKELNRSEPLLVSVLDVPDTQFSYEQLNSTKPITLFKNETPNVKSYYWVIENIATATTPDFEYSFVNKGSYNVSLTTTIENGCSNTFSKSITIENDYNLLAPTAFTPDGDNRNDYFIPKALTVLNLPFTMTIYDRQGNMLYQTNDFSKPWDGTYANGMPAQSGIYVWIVQLTNEKGETEIYKDHIMLTK